MNIYEWPSVTEPESGDDPLARQQYFAQRRPLLDAEGAVRASRGLAPGDALRAPVAGALNLWVPIGPATILGGQAEGGPRVSGRVRALAVHPDGQRVYAAAGNGGIWYSSNAGGSWRSIGGLAATATPGVTRPAHRHACGAILVRFDPAAPNDEAQDTVLVGTGETMPRADARPGSRLGGIGILVARGPAAGTADDPWTEEAPNLLGRGVYRLAAEPEGSRIVAATSIGLLERPVVPGQGVRWERIQAAPFDTLEDVCTDAVWTRGGGGRPARLWVWTTGAEAGLWVLPAGATEFKKIETPTADHNLRSVIAAADPPAKVYVLNNRYRSTDSPAKRPALFRIDAAGAGDPTATEVTDSVPDVLREQGEYDIAMVVDPGNADRVVIAGAYLETTNPAGEPYEEYNGSIVVAEIGLKAGKLTFGHATPPTMIGVGVHADVHELQFSNAGARLWTACDGGVFRSDHPTKEVGFVACNDGLAIAEANFIASHPTCEGFAVLGLQDNGVIERFSNGIWRMKFAGDGGGVAFNPVKTEQFIGQYVKAKWRSSSGGFASLHNRGKVSDASAENKDSSFYSTPGVHTHPRVDGAGSKEIAELLIGTDRVWYTNDWGASWVTLPTGTDPATPTTNNRSQDQLGEGVTACRWAGPDVAWILTQPVKGGLGGRVLRLQRTAAGATGPGAWNRPPEVVLRRESGGKAKKQNISMPAALRAAVAWTDLAVNLDAGGGTKGAVYLGTAGHPTNEEVDTLWWFDGTDAWHPTKLRSEGVPAPVTAVLCDPAHPELVFVGTTIGVLQGKRTLVSGQPPNWDWDLLVNGLPEAAVEDLSLVEFGSMRLLRAAIASRGVWEIEIDANTTALTYVRAHQDDLRRRSVASATKRDGKTERSWHASPDVRPRLAPAPVGGPTPPKTWTRKGGGFSREALQRFQAALRSQKTDPRCRPTGKWDLYFEEVLRDHGAPVDPPTKLVSIDKGFFDSVMKAPHATAEPWGSGVPSEADLYEFTPPLAEGELKGASCRVAPGRMKVDVVVHHRGSGSVDGADVRVTLLHWIDPRTKGRAKYDDSGTWFKEDVPWIAAVNEVLNSGGGTTSQSFGAGWAFTGSGANRRKTLTGQRFDSAHAGIATFDIDLRGARRDLLVLLVAVVRAGGDVALQPAKLRDLVLANPGVAVRSLRVSDTP